LGYKITYYLDKFEYYKRTKSFVYKGNLIFNQDLATNNPEKSDIERRRKNTFHGSRMHFFRALWLNDLKSTGFVVYNSISNFLDYSNIVFEDDRHRKFLRGEIARDVNLKFAPEIRFRIDDSFDTVSRIDAILNSERVKRDLEGADDETPDNN